MGSLSSLYISQSYQSLAHLGTNNALSAGTMTILQDGLGNSLNISFDGTNISSSGNIYGANITASVINTGSFVSTSSFNSYTSSTNARLNSIETTTASLNNSISALNTNSASVNISISNLNTATASLFTSSSNALYTASFNNTTRNLTFTKGNNTTFSVNIPDVSGSTFDTGSFVSTSSFNSYTQSNDNKVNSLIDATGSYATTGSNIFTGANTFQTSINAQNGLAIVGQTTFGDGQILNTLSLQNISGSLVFNKIATASKVDLQNLSLLVSGTFTSSLQQGYIWVGDSTGKTTTVSTSSLVTNINTGSLVTTASFNSYTQSTNVRLTNIESTTASLLIETQNLELFSASALISISNLNQSSASQQVSINALNVFTASQSTASIVTSIDNLNTFTSSANIRLNNLETTSASVNVSIANINSTTASQATSISNLNTSASLALTTASLSGQTLTFTKGDNSTFGIILPDVSGSDITALNQFTASQLLINTGYNTFTSSTNTSISSLNQFTASQSTASLVTSITELNTFSASAKISISALNTYTASQSTASLVTSIDNLNNFSASALVSISNLNSTTQSLFTSTSLSLTTASFNNGTRDLTFTKGNGTTFSVNIPDASGSAGDFVTTASFNAYTQSVNSDLNSIHSTTASLNSTTASQQISIDALNTNSASVNISVTNINQFTQSANIRLNNLETTSASVNISIANINSTTASQAISITNLNSFSQSAQTSINALNAATSSYLTSSADITALNAFTASQLLINTGYNTFTSSANQRLSSLETTSASVNISISALNTFTASQSTASIVTSINNLNTFSASALVSINELNTNSASVNISISNINQFTQSAQISINSINAASSSWITESETASFARTNVDNNFTANQTFTNITAVSASFTYVQTLYETASVIYSSGSNQFGDELTDVQTLSGSVKVQGSLTVNGTPVLTSSVDISGLVTTASFNAYTQSNDQKVSSLETNSASVNTSITNINSTTASLNTSVSNLNQFTASQSTASLVTSINNLNTFSASALVSITNINSTTASLNTSVTNLNSATSSLFTSASLALVTASFDNGTRNLTFTKGDATTFNVNIPDVSGSTINTGSFATTSSFNAYTQSNDQRVSSLETNSASVNISINALNAATSSYATSAITASSLITASVSLNTITFTKGDGTTFPITVNTGSGGGGTTDTGSLMVTGSVAGNVLTFTKGDATTFSLTVATGSGGGTIDTGSFATTGSNTFTGVNTFNERTSLQGINVYTGSEFGTYIGNRTNFAPTTAGNVPGNSHTVIGYDALGSFGNGDVNTSIGRNSLSNLISGSSNLAIGAFTGLSLTGGNENTFIGANAGNALVNGNSNFFLGASSGGPLTSGSFNIIIGINNQGPIITGSGNFIIGAAGGTKLQNNVDNQLSITYGTDLSPRKFLFKSGSAASNALLYGGLEIENTLTASLAQGFTYVGNASGITTAVATSSFGGGTTYINPTLNPYSGSLILVANTFTSSSFAHISASANGQVNLVFKNNNNTADTILSGSNNIFTNPAAVTTGYKRYIGGSNNLYLNSTNGINSQITASATSVSGVRPVMNNNIFNGTGNFAINQATNPGTHNYQNNIINGTTTINALAFTGSLNFNNNFNNNGTITINAASASVTEIATGLSGSGTFSMNGNGNFGGTMTITSPRILGTAQTQTTNNNVIAGGSITITNISSSVSVTATGNLTNGAISYTNAAASAIHTSAGNVNTIQGAITVNAIGSAVGVANNLSLGGPTITNLSFSGSAGGGLMSANRNLFQGQAHTLTVTGSQDAGTTSNANFSDNTILGKSNTIFSNLTGAGNYRDLNSNVIGGQNLIVSASNSFSLTEGGGAYFGRYNADDGRRNKTGENIFVVGTGNSTTRKTGFLIDSGSNSYFEGTLNVSGSTTLSGSLYIQSGSTLPSATGSSILTWNPTTGQVSQSPIATLISSSFSVGAFNSTITQSGSAAVSQSMTYNNTDISNGITLNGGGTQLTIANSGTYNIQFSAQLNAPTGADTIWIWLKKNGTNVSNTGTKLVLKNNEANVAAWNFVVPAIATDYFELVWQSLDGHATLLTEAAAGNYPAIPSVIVTVTQVE